MEEQNRGAELPRLLDGEAFSISWPLASHHNLKASRADWRFSLIFIDHGFKMNAEYYQKNILERVLKPGTCRPWLFPHNSPLTRSVCINQELLKDHVPLRLPRKNFKGSIIFSNRVASNGTEYYRPTFGQHVMVLLEV